MDSPQIRPGQFLPHSPTEIFAGIVHRDLKPVNIMIVEDSEAAGGERAKVLDFGLAKVIDPELGRSGELTGTGTLLGTPAYMSPEQCRSARGVEAKSDVYSLGVILYEMLSSDIPFDAETDAELLSMHMYKDPPSIRDKVPFVPEELADLVHRMLAKEPSDRPTANEVVNELLQVPIVQDQSKPHRVSNKQLTPAAIAPTAMATPEEIPGHLADGKSESEITKVRAPNAALLRDAQAAPVRAEGKRASQQTAPRSRALLWVLGILVVLAASAGGGWLGWMGAQRAGRPPEPTTGTLPKEVPGLPPTTVVTPHTGTEPGRVASTVLWSITTVPTHAQVLLTDGQVLGETPLNLQRPAEPGMRTLRVTAPGYHDSMLQVAQDQDANVIVSLKPLQPSTPVTAVRLPALLPDGSTLPDGQAQEPSKIGE